MRLIDLQEAITEAQRFLDRAEELWRNGESAAGVDGVTTITGSWRTAQVRRASLDLTRALARLAPDGTAGGRGGPSPE